LSVVVMALVGPLVVGRAVAGMEKAATSAPSLSPELMAMIRQPRPWVTMGALNGMSIGLLWLMVHKPGWTQAILVEVGAGLLGAVISAMVVKSGK
jgi:hypothetical protein